MDSNLKLAMTDALSLGERNVGVSFVTKVSSSLHEENRNVGCVMEYPPGRRQGNIFLEASEEKSLSWENNDLDVGDTPGDSLGHFKDNVGVGRFCEDVLDLGFLAGNPSNFSEDNIDVATIVESPYSHAEDSETGVQVLESNFNNPECLCKEICGRETDPDDERTIKHHQQQFKRKRLSRISFSIDKSGKGYNGEEDEEEDDVWMKSRDFDSWASAEVLAFIQPRKEDLKKPLSWIAVKKLLWSYIGDNKLQHPRRDGQIICDEKLKTLFGRECIGRFEMEKLPSSHLASKQQNTFKIRETLTTLDDDIAEISRSKDRRVEDSNEKQKPIKKSGESKCLKADLNDFAAINVSNISLIYLNRSFLEDLLGDTEFNTKAIGAFVRIRVSGMNKNDACYRLVQTRSLDGTSAGIKSLSESAERKMSNVAMEVLNLQKREEFMIYQASNQDFTEEECQRLRQCIKCGFIKAMTVGELEKKAKSLQEVKVKVWLEAELLRLSHLRDRASEKGNKGELRKCMKKIKLLTRPQEKEKRLRAAVEIIADPHMDPDFESDVEEKAAKENQGFPIFLTLMKCLGQQAFGKARDVDSDKKSTNWLEDMNLEEKNALDLNKMEFDNMGWDDTMGRNQETDTGWNNQSGFVKGDSPSDREFSKIANTSEAERQPGYGRVAVDSGTSLSGTQSADCSDKQDQKVQAAATVNAPVTGLPAGHPVINTGQGTVDEKEKIWHYEDPTGKIQGPFSLERLKKWEKKRLFPVDKKIWKMTEGQDKSVVLTDALSMKFTEKPPPASLLQSTVGAENYSEIGWGGTSLCRDLGVASMTCMSRNNWREQGGTDGWVQNGIMKVTAAWDANNSDDTWDGGCWTMDKLQLSISTKPDNDGWNPPVANLEGNSDSHVKAEKSRVEESWRCGMPESGG